MPENRRYFALNGLDRELERHMAYDSGFFVELGANDGIHQSNTLYFERYRNWRGVLIEPVPHNYFRCKQNRSPENRFFCNACVSFEYTDPFVPIYYCNLMSTTLGLESDLDKHPDQHVSEGRKHLPPGEEPILFGAAAKPLNDLLVNAGAPREIDLLSLDVEGAEIEVLKGVDFSAFSFKHLCLECRDIRVMNLFLKKKGYRLIERLSLHDYLFVPA